MSVTSTSAGLRIIPNSSIAPAPAEGRDRVTYGADRATQPGQGYEAWVIDLTDTGESGGGAMTLNAEFPDDQYYYTVTALRSQRQDTGVEVNCTMNITLSNWENFRGALSSNTMLQILPTITRTLSWTVTDPDRFEPIYLGRPLGTRLLPVLWVNTDTVVYDLRVSGLRSLRPGMPWYTAIQQGRLL